MEEESRHIDYARETPGDEELVSRLSYKISYTIFFVILTLTLMLFTPVIAVSYPYL